MKLRILKLHPEARAPQYATEGAACFDLHAVIDLATCKDSEPRYTEPVTIRTGLAFEVPEGHVMLIFSRSGHGFRDGVSLSNAVGVIDPGYTGEVKVQLVQDARTDDQGMDLRRTWVKPGDRIAQALVLPVPRVEFEVKDKLTEALRGQKGIGSTGA